MRYQAFEKHYHLMLLPGMLLLLLFSTIPMFGLAIAFQDFKLGMGVWRSPFIGFENFAYLLEMSDSRIIFRNTIVIAVSKMIAGLIVPLAFAVLLNEIRIRWFKRSVQTVVYLPHFLSWVILAGILVDILSLKGLINQTLAAMGIEPVMFLASNFWFPIIVVASDIWKEFGFAAIIYLAALAGINPSLYESAALDGAGRLRRMLSVTLPGLAPVIVLMAALSIGNILNAGFDQIFNLYNPLVYESGDIIDTYVYRSGLLQAQYGLATAVGLMKSLVSFVLIIVSYALASKFANYRIF